MKYRVRLLARANRDLERIFAWLAQRSPAGAAAWYEAAIEALTALRDGADQHGLAIESRGLRKAVREAFLRPNVANAIGCCITSTAMKFASCAFAVPDSRPFASVI